jgi:hypothetical protein
MVRFHGLFDDDMSAFSIREDGSIYYSWFNADSIFDFLLSIGMRPLVELRYEYHKNRIFVVQCGNMFTLLVSVQVLCPHKWHQEQQQSFIIEETSPHLVLCDSSFSLFLSLQK